MAETVDLARTDPEPLPGVAASWAPGEPPVGESVLPSSAAGGSNFLKDVGLDPAKSAAATHDLLGAEREKQKADNFIDRQATDRLEQDRSRMDQAFRLENAAASDPALKPWQADQERAQRMRGPMEQFGSIGFIFAMAASAFTRTPMTSALNAGAAAMTAIQQGDEKAYESAYQAWKDNSNLALKRFDMERTLYDDANKMATTDINMWQHKRLAVAAQFEDKKTIALLENGMSPDVLKLDAERVKMADQLRKSQEGMREYDEKWRLYREGVKAYQKEHPGEDDEHPTPGFVKAKAEALVRATQAVKGQQTESPEQRYERMMAIERAREDARSAEGKANREAAMDRLVATLGSREQIAEMTDERIRELAGNQIDLKERLQKEREAARASEGAKNRQSRENIAANRLDAMAERANLSNETRTKIASMNNEARARLQEYLETGRERRGEMSDQLKRDLSAAGIESRQIIEAVRQAGASIRQDAREQNAFDRLKLSQEGKEKLAGMNISAREKLQEYLEGGRESRSARVEGGREHRAEMSDELRREIAQMSSKDRKEIEATKEAALKERAEIIFRGRENIRKVGPASDAVHKANEEADQKAEKGDFGSPPDLAAKHDWEAKRAQQIIGEGKFFPIDQSIVGELKNYPGKDRSDLSFIDKPMQTKLESSFTSRENLERIAKYTKDNPDSIGYIAALEKGINLDKYQDLFAKANAGDKTAQAAATAAVNSEFDKLADGRLQPTQAAKAKILNKMITTQAFSDAAIAGSRGGTIYLDRAFREIYDQASSPAAFYGTLKERYIDANNFAEKYGLGFAGRSDKQNQPFWERFASPSRESGPVKTPPINMLREGYATPFGDKGTWTLQNGRPVQVGP